MMDSRVYEATMRTLRDRLKLLPSDGDDATRAYRVRALLEELGVSCDESADLQDLDAILIASAHGTDAMIAARLNDEQRLVAYARLIARLLTGELHSPLDAKMEYAVIASAPSKRERDEERMVLQLAHAIAEGDLDLAPRPLFEDVPPFTFAFTPRSAARSTLGGFHWWSNFWYRRSNIYRRWRARRDVSNAIGRVVVALNRAGLPAT